MENFKLILTFFVIVLSICFQSCDEDAILEEMPLDFASPENSFVTLDDFNSSIYALYERARTTLSGGEHRPLDYIYGTDLGFNGAQQLNQRFGSYLATLTPQSVQALYHWQSYYKIIKGMPKVSIRIGHFWKIFKKIVTGQFLKKSDVGWNFRSAIQLNK